MVSKPKGEVEKTTEAAAATAATVPAWTSHARDRGTRAW